MMNDLIAAAAGRCDADLVIRGARVANVVTLEYEDADVAVFAGKIAGVGKGYAGRKYIDAKGAVLIPGLIDGHIHIESSMLAPAPFAEAVAPLGTTTVMADPHEIANVMGMRGIEYMYTASRGLPVDVFLGAPSCVPASEYESPHERLGIMSVREMFRRNLTQHLGEVMDFSAAVRGDAELIGKIAAAGDVPLTGHAPGLRGKDLNGYIAAGMSSDHECTNIDEAREKLRRGMWLMMREGTSFRYLRTLLPLIKENGFLAARCMAVTDDMTPRYLLEVGHMDAKVRMMIKEGVDPLTALRMVTLTPADYFMLHDRGAVIPGYQADLVLVDSLEDFNVLSVWKNGRLVAESGRLVEGRDVNRSSISTVTPVEPPSRDRFAVKSAGSSARGADGTLINVIGIETGSAITRMIRAEPLVRDGAICSDISRDIIKIVSVERHNGTGRVGVGFLHGFGLQRGALASSVSHDAHNIVAVGADDVSLSTAVARVCEEGGGLAVADGEQILGVLPLPIAGLMTHFDARTASAALDSLESQGKTLGVRSDHPFIDMSFLSLSVIPEIRITDLGYVNSSIGRIPLFAE